MKKNLIVIQGIPGSGKGYLARQLLKKDKSKETIIVNRDDIRSMLGDYWVPKREGLVTRIELNMIQEGLRSGYDVIVDATNLNPRTIKNLKFIATSEGVAIMFKPIRVSIKKAFLQMVYRVIKGGRQIPYKVIKGFYNRYKDTIGV